MVSVLKVIVTLSVKRMLATPTKSDCRHGVDDGFGCFT